MRLYIIRHGETQWNKLRKVQGHSDISLNERGRHLARETKKGLWEIPFDVAYTSPLIRAKETAQLVLEGRGIPLHEEKRIQEIGFGEAEGMPYRKESIKEDEIEFNKFFSDTGNYKAPSGGESIQQLNERVCDFLEELFSNEELQDKTVLLSTHGATYTAMLNIMRGQKDISEFWKRGVPPNCAVAEVEVREGAVTVLEEGRIYY